MTELPHGWQRFEPENLRGLDRIAWALATLDVGEPHVNWDRWLLVSLNRLDGRYYYGKMLHAPRMEDPCDSLDEAIERAEAWPQRTWWQRLLGKRPGERLFSREVRL